LPKCHGRTGKVICLDSISPTCVSIPIFQKFEMGLKKFRNFENRLPKQVENKNYMGEKVLELLEMCKCLCFSIF
jgi:hypothetical protein